MEAINTPSKMASSWTSLETFLDDVDGKLKSFGKRAEGAAGEAQLQTHLGLMEVEEFWSKRKDEILTVVARLHDAQSKPKAALEEGRIELYFGKEDAKDAIAKLRHRLEATETNIMELGTAANADAKAALHRLKDAYDAIKGKLLH